MQQSELYAALVSVCQTAYREFKTAVEPPFICYFHTDSPDLKADDSNFVPIAAFDIELYADQKDLDLEAALESELASLGLVWDKTENWIASERLHQVVYSTSFLLTPADESA